ncbi:MAG: HAMP domain-containing sensor histidine kinase [Pseudanabaenaceae cyanobacterium bins.68]|nr:HAMP domain-containing sensor histidine kinase [Pseudanabaenaceae cyanobacterium bins.68]
MVPDHSHIPAHAYFAGMIGIIFTLEFFTPSMFIFGYLYTVPILFASGKLPRKQIIPITLFSIGLTLLNILVPDFSRITTLTVVNRLIAAFALLITGFLSDRNRHYQAAISDQQIRLESNTKLMGLREDFTFTLTHDLKTPLLGAIETLKAFELKQFGGVSPIQTSVIHTMIRSHQNSLQLLETLLEIYRNDLEGLPLHLTTIDLTSLAEEAVSALLGLAASRRIHFSFDYGEANIRRSLWVKADRMQLERVFNNLLVNAINHSQKGDRVEIVLESSASWQVVKIMDRGSGIHAAELPHLFERFFQGQTNRQAKGTGLGLYLSRQIIDAHGGKIWAENRISKGALFGFKLLSSL